MAAVIVLLYHGFVQVVERTWLAVVIEAELNSLAYWMPYVPPLVPRRDLQDLVWWSAGLRRLQQSEDRRHMRRDEKIFFGGRGAVSASTRLLLLFHSLRAVGYPPGGPRHHPEKGAVASSVLGIRMTRPH